MANIAAVGREADIRDKSGKRVKFSRGRSSETRVEGKGKGESPKIALATEMLD